MYQHEKDVKHDFRVHQKSNFRQNCQNIKSSLDYINHHKHINNNRTYSDRYLDSAFFGLKFGSKKHQNLITMYDYYTAGSNIEEWASRVAKQYDVTSVTCMFDFLRSLEAYFLATLNLTSARKINKGSKTKSELVYKIWRAHLEDCLIKIDRVLNSL